MHLFGLNRSAVGWTQAWRAKMRAFVSEEITPFVDEWEAANEIPLAIYRRAAEVGLLSATVGWCVQTMSHASAPVGPAGQ